jgi:hypothetical protein
VPSVFLNLIFFEKFIEYLYFILRKTLYYVFDFVFLLEEALNVSKLNLGDYAKLYSLLALSSFKNGAYLSPSMLVVKNCDAIFSRETENIVLLEEDEQASVFLFKPSLEIFKAVTASLVDSGVNGKV